MAFLSHFKRQQGSILKRLAISVIILVGVQIFHEHTLDARIQFLFNILLNLINKFRNSLQLKTCSYGAATLRMDFRRKRADIFISKK
jgi:hypothetical protein